MNPADFAQTIYSQCGEDLFLKQNFFGEERNGFYVDVGAHHPYRFSNTALFHAAGWHGINIDVDQRAIDAFNAVRPNDINLLCGVAGEAGMLNLHLFGEGAVNTLSDNLAAEYQKVPGRDVISVHPIEVRPLADILDQHLPSGQTIDLMSVDVEGLDEAVLRSNDWKRYRPRALCVEMDGVLPDEIDSQPIVRFLGEKGYRVRGLLTLSAIFQRLY